MRFCLSWDAAYVDSSERGSVCDLTLVVVQQSREERFSLGLQFFADGGSFDQIPVLLKHLQQLKQ